MRSPNRFSGLAPLALFVAALTLLGCPDTTPPGDGDTSPIQAEAQDFLDQYTARYLELYYEVAQAEWASNTRIVEGDSTNAERTQAAHAAYAAYTGSADVIEATRGFLDQRDQLTEIQARQLEAVLYDAANNPATVADLVEERIAAETRQNEDLYGFTFTIDGAEVSANTIDDRLASSTDVAERQATWEASKEVGAVLRDGLVDLVRLRNGTVQALGYDDYFHYQVSDYGMTVDEMMALNRRFVEEVWPLYRQLHTWARYELAERYGEEVPTTLPAHWLPNRWGQDWQSMVTVEGIDLDSVLAPKGAEWVVQQAEAFYVSLGFGPLPAIFWQESELYPLPEGADYKKNNHASAWHLDLRHDVRSLMSVQPNQRWWTTTHHELGHIYYYLAYTHPDVPPLLRAGANRGFHEAVGSLLGMAATQKPFLVAKGLVDEHAEVDPIQALLQEALDTIVFIPFSSGTMTHFEHDLYSGAVQAGEINARWWQYAEGFQGVTPPSARDETYCDACTKTHINDDPAQYYDYAISQVLLQQLHRHIATEVLDQTPQATNYFGSRPVGDFLKGFLSLGANCDWREVMREQLGEELSAAAMLAYFEPLTAWLDEQNQGREHTLPEVPAI